MEQDQEWDDGRKEKVYQVYQRCPVESSSHLVILTNDSSHCSSIVREQEVLQMVI